MRTINKPTSVGAVIAVALTAATLTACGATAKVATPPDDRLDDDVRTRAATPAPSPGFGGAQPAITYYRDVAPVIQQKCLACHDSGGLAPFTLTTPDDVVNRAGDLAFFTGTREMPPWMPGPLSPAMRDDFSLSDDEIAVFQAFSDEVDASFATGAPLPLGDPAEQPPPVPPIGFPLTNPDVTAAMAEPFTALGLDTGEDEFRCFLLDVDVPVERLLVGYRFVPGNNLVDHHAIITLYSRDDIAALQNLDDTSSDAAGTLDGRAGWSCFGEDIPAALGVQPVGRIGAWTPGNNGVVEFPGTAIKVQANVVAVVSMHYNVTNAIGASGVDTTLSTDQSSLEMYFAPLDESEGIQQVFGAGANLNPLLRAGQSPIPPNAAAHSVERRVAFADLNAGLRAALTSGGVQTVHLTGVGAHGHLLLEHFEVIADEGGAGEKVLLDIPQWDFHWQGQYTFVDDITLDVDTPITVRCTYNNTSENRAEEGLDPESVQVTSCEGTTCEMCIAGLQFVINDPTP